MEKTLVWITTRLFWPPDSGHKVELYHYCQSLHERYGYDIHLFSFLEDGQSYKTGDEPDFIKSVTLSSKVAKLEVAWNIASHSWGRSVWPLQSCLYHSKRNASRLRVLIDQTNPGVIIADMIRTAEYIAPLEGSGAKRILNMEDLISKRFERLIETCSVEEIPGLKTGRLTRGLPKSAVSRIATFVLKSEVERLRSREISMAKIFDNILFVSKAETLEYNRLSGLDKSVTAGLGVDYDYFSRPPKGSPAGLPDKIAFLGNMTYEPNVRSLEFIASEVLPKLKSRAKLEVYGVASEKVKRDFRNFSALDIVGRVDDLRDSVGTAKVFLCPIAYGTGIKTKILEAMAMGVPVVTNSVGAEGLDVKDGQDIIVRESADDLAVAVDELLLSEEKRVHIGERGQAYVKNHHRWDDILQVFEEIGL